MEEILKQLLAGQNKLIQRMDKLESEISTVKGNIVTKEDINRLEN